ncbi:MAG: glycosyltransferase family 4 protein [Bacteroidales bacterium]|nr:glycosyltransferase family 4 protein [Bacteroidales bacterium]
MKVLFVSGGNSSSFDIAPFIKSQGESLEKEGISIIYFPIKEKGILGYLRASVKIRKYIREHSVDLVHAHYTLSGWSAVLSLTNKPIVLSLMGSDAYGDYVGVNKIRFSSRYLILLTYLIQPFVKAIICKSEHIQSFVYSKDKSFIIPNGIQLDNLQEPKALTKESLGLKSSKRYILFLGNKTNVRKNYAAAEKAVNLLNRNSVELIAPYPIDHETALSFMQVADVVVVPSLMEGSPNVVKEAMASNCPVVATNVGDVKWLFGSEPGYFLTDFDINNISKNIGLALDFSSTKGRTNGKNRIKELQLQSEKVAKKIISIYEKTLS